MTLTMAKVPNNGITTKLFTKVILSMDLKQVLENSNSMVIFMKEISLTDNSTVKENTTSMKLVRFMRVISMRTRFMEVD